MLRVHSKQLTGEGSWNHINDMVQWASDTMNLIIYVKMSEIGDDSIFAHGTVNDV